jgi:hypothetical protein
LWLIKIGFSNQVLWQKSRPSASCKTLGVSLNPTKENKMKNIFADAKKIIKIE